METSLHKKLKSMVSMSRGTDRHWKLAGCKTVWIEGVHSVVTTKRAFYAAFVGDIPENMDVQSSCSFSGCLQPDHMILKPARRKSRPLSLKDHLSQLTEKYQAIQHLAEGNLPSGITLKAIDTVKFLTDSNNAIKDICSAVNLPMHEVMKIRGGFYDQVANRLRKTSGVGKNKKHDSPANMPGGILPEAPVPSTSFQDPLDIDEESAAWLAQLGR
jgi:hypothetical protein